MARWAMSEFTDGGVSRESTRGRPYSCAARRPTVLRLRFVPKRRSSLCGVVHSFDVFRRRQQFSLGIKFVESGSEECASCLTCAEFSARTRAYRSVSSVDDFSMADPQRLSIKGGALGSRECDVIKRQNAELMIYY